jgi:hypothetical protein
MAHNRSLTTHQMFVYMYHSTTNEISFTTHPLDIAYYVLMYHITLWFLFILPCQTWWWYYNKRAETCCLSSNSYILIKFCCDLTYPPCHLRYCNSHTTGMNHLKIQKPLLLRPWSEPSPPSVPPLSQCLLCTCIYYDRTGSPICFISLTGIHWKLSGGGPANV